ncbi:MAG: glucosaminidase domain-containing protein [Treponema sp.]|nr:glucosaminidase domain-containing protein [Treponema sp.]
MRQTNLSFLLGLVCMLFFSCSIYPSALRPQNPPERPVVPTYIMGTGVMSEELLTAFLFSSNPNADALFVQELAGIYIEEASIENVNHDVAFSQMCLETGFLKYGNLVTPDMNNFCGLGSIDAEHIGERFPNPRIGVRAHIQHLKAYGADEPLKQELVDPRYRWVTPKGKAPDIMGLAGNWAADPQYGEKIIVLLRRLYESSTPN